MIHVTDTILLDEREVAERFVRATGPRGQNANKDATAVELRLDLGTSTLPVDLKARVRAAAGRHVTKDDVLIVVGRVFRSQRENRDAAHAQLLAILQRAANPRRSRTTTPPSAASDHRLEVKHFRAAVKQARGRRGEDR
jgi:ribosome-associated protein